MNRDWLIAAAADTVKGLALAALACCSTLAPETAMAQPSNDFAPANALATIAPSQNDSTFTPDPYYTPEITLDSPANGAPNPADSWSPPGTPDAVKPKAVAVLRQRKTQSVR